MVIKRVFHIKNRTGSRCLRCDKAIDREVWKDDKEYICPHCGQVHLVTKQGKVVVITVKERAELHRKSKLSKMDQLIKDKALLRIELKDKNRQIEELEKENAKLVRKIERLEGKKDVFQDERTEEADEECV